MNLRERRILAWVSLVIGLAILGGLWTRPYRGVRREAARVREALIRDGYRVELGEFHRSIEPAAEARGDAVTRWAAHWERVAEVGRAVRMEPVSGSSAASEWRGLARDAGRREGEGLGPVPPEEYRAELARLGAMLRAGDPAFRIPTNVYALQAVYLSHLKACGRALAGAAVEALRSGDQEAASGHVAALTAMATRRVLEPQPVAHRYAYQLRELAFETTWEALRTNGWSDAELAGWQRRWAEVATLPELPDVVAFARAEALSVCRQARDEPGSGASRFLGELWNAVISNWDRPSWVWQRVAREWRIWRGDARYRFSTSYREEAALGLYYRDRELDMRTAVTLPTWEAMRGRLAATVGALATPPDFRGLEAVPGPSSVRPDAVPPEESLLARAMESEAHRRVLLAALAVERHRLRHERLPESLGAIDADLRLGEAVDPMDGQPLRYRLEGAGGYVVYSVGLDGSDDGGRLEQREWRAGRSGRRPDVVWPREATPEEVAAWEAARRAPRFTRLGSVADRARVPAMSAELMRRFGLLPGPAGRGPGFETNLPPAGLPPAE